MLSSAVVPSSSSSSSSSETATVSLPAGVTLPRSGTVYLITPGVNGSVPPLVQLHPAEIVSNSHAAGNFARSMVYAGPHASLELKGLNAVAGTDDRQPTILVRINGDDPELLRSRVHLIRLQQTKDRRVVSSYSQNVFGGQRAKKYDDVAVTKADAEPDVWLTLTPDEPLKPGEYCVVFMPKDATAWPDTVYDFNVAVDVAKREK